MRLAFPTPPKSSLGTPNLFFLNDLLQYLCKCAQTHKSPISKKMNLLYVAINPTLYGHYSRARHTLFGRPLSILRRSRPPQPCNMAMA
jgi:hypothetical protein